MSDLARRLFEADAKFQRRHGIRDGLIDKWDYLGSDDLAREEFQVVAAEALAYVKEKLGRERVAEAIRRVADECPADECDPLTPSTSLRIADAILVLLDEPNPDPERREE